MANATERALRRKRRVLRRLRNASRPLPRPFKKKEGSKQAEGKRRSSVLEEKKRREKRKEKEREEEEEEEEESGGEPERDSSSPSLRISTEPFARQLQFFLDRFESANGFKISPLELEPVKDTCIVKLSHGINQDAENLCKHVKDVFGFSWKEILCERKLSEGKIDAGSPAVLIISTSALRSLELLRGLQPLTRECCPVKLFAKHIKVEDQVSLLKNRVNIASGTPSRIKKLIDIDALGLSRLAVIVIDMHRDAKGYSLFTLPQVSNEFWDLYKSHFHGRLMQGDLRICFYGPASGGVELGEALSHGDE